MEPEESMKNESFDVIFLIEKSEEILLQTESYAKQISVLKKYNLRFFDDYLECGIQQTFRHEQTGKISS